MKSPRKNFGLIFLYRFIMTSRQEAELLVDDWLKNDFDPSTRQEVAQWLVDEKFSEIEKRLSGARKLVFGTAGLRARMGPGFDRMNCLTVLQTTQGLAKYINETCIYAKKDKSVVVGFDGRHNSESFAHVAAAVFITNGFRVHLIERPAPTPFTPFLVPLVGASCGVQITASHNPKFDNGYKLFWSNGAQIIPPIDSGVASKIENYVDISVFKILDSSTLRISVNDNVVNEFVRVSKQYVSSISSELALKKNACEEKFSFAYTAMHGVGYIPFRNLFASFFADPNIVLIPVKSQILIDPEFSTVSFPNPEEKGALRVAIADAESKGCNYVLANDPDADRFTAAEKQADGSWYQFTGDELGLLFADYQTRRAKSGLIVSSVVSSQMVRTLCKARGFTYADCLTGFKWIANESIKRREGGLTHLLGYEEAIGYQLSAQVADKDGLSAGCVFVQMVLEGGSLKQRIADIQKNEIGYFVTNNGYYSVDDPDITSKIFAEFRDSGMKRLGEFSIRSVRDVTRGTDTDAEATKLLPATPEAEMIQLMFDNGAVVTIRASGTEPKVKYYSEVSSRESADKAKKELDTLVETIKSDFYQPMKYPMKEQPLM